MPTVKKKSYKQPPITEAIIGINFDTPLEPSELETINGRFLKHYSRHQVVQNYSVKVALDQHGQANADGTAVEKGHRRSNVDVNELMVLWRSSFTISQLAPYPGWDVFFARFVRDWRIWKRAAGYRSVSRVGVRFINRIDIPIQNDCVQHENYLNVYPQLPKILATVGPYAVQALVPLEDINCVLTLNTASMPAPILGHVSFLLDLDIARDADAPQKDDAIFELLHQIRDRKNEVFESCVSNKSRKLFRP